MAEYEPCYVFNPTDKETKGLSNRPEKRRKVIKDVADKSNNGFLFGPLFGGREDQAITHSRFELFNTTWTQLEGTLKQILQDAQVGVTNDIAAFVRHASVAKSENRMPTGLVAGGPGASISSGFADVVSRQAQTDENIIVIQLSSDQASNLKSALKHLNREAVNHVLSDIDGTRHLSYDLQILHDHVQDNEIEKVVILFRDSESFNESLLADLISILGSWKDRLPFVLLFSIATSIDFFEEKLSQTTVKLLQGTRFDLAQVEVEILFKAALTSECPSPVLLGPGLSNIILQRHRETVQSTDDFIRTLKYMYMTYYFSDPLSILTSSLEVTDLDRQHADAIRGLESFKRLAESLLDKGDHVAVQNLLNDDQALQDTVIAELEASRGQLAGVLTSIETLSTIQSFSTTKPPNLWSELYIKAMSGELADATVLRDALLMAKKTPSDTLRRLLVDLSELSDTHSAVAEILDDLDQLIEQSKDKETPMRSEHDVHHNTVRTTVVAQKVGLSKQTSALSQQDKEYSSIVNRVGTYLKEYFKQHLINPKDVFLNEVLIYDAKSPYRDVFMPKPRFAVERALSSPHDYLGCNCCDAIENGLSASQPATAILYQLYLESGSLINTADLWSAFQTIVAAEDAGDEEAEQERVLALFSTALAELKYLGMIKSSRKKADHLMKLSWKGL